MKAIYLSVFLLIGTIGELVGQPIFSFEAEDATLIGSTEVVDCSAASGGRMVRGLSNGSDNALVFESILLDEEVTLELEIFYYSTTDRLLTYVLNGGEPQTIDVLASGDWCFQGGVPGSVRLEVAWGVGNNELKFYNGPIIDVIHVQEAGYERQPATYYVSSSLGDDDNDGLSADMPWQSLNKVNNLFLIPGDEVLLKSGDTFYEQLVVAFEGGNAVESVRFSSYSEGEQPIIDARGKLSTVYIVNSGYLDFENLNITNNGGDALEPFAETSRYGFLVRNTFTDGTVFNHYHFRDLTIQNIFPSLPLTDDAESGKGNAFSFVHALGDEPPTKYRDVLIENCYITRTARHALRMKSINGLIIRNNLLEHIGGAGMVIGGKTSNALVEYNTVDYSGSDIDDRMAKRGSGLWTFGSRNVIVQYNRFLHARGKADSYGMHIDFGNRNVVYQYNYSEDNEGGFVEVLGDNVNVGYRYNVSIGDGWRVRNSSTGKVFWVSNYAGASQQIGSDSVFVYNNSAYVLPEHQPEILIMSQTQNTRFYNNIVQVAGSFGDVNIRNSSGNNDFDYNLWHGPIPMVDQNSILYQGSHALYEDPLLDGEVPSTDANFMLLEGSPALGSGQLIYNSETVGEFDYFHNHGGSDYFGNPVSTTSPPNRGAYNGPAVVVNTIDGALSGNGFAISPNPLREGSALQITIPDEFENQKVLVQLIGLGGRVLIEQLWNGSPIGNAFEGITKGYYLVRMSNNSTVVSKPLLVL